MGAGVTPYFANNISALGDSISVGYDIKRLRATDIPNSWSTGTTSASKSVFVRLLAANAKATVSANVAIPGALMVDLFGQVSSARILPSTQLVTILMGGNDVCAPNVTAMTPVSAFTENFRRSLVALDAKLVDPRAVIYVASIPDVYQLWALFKSNFAAQLVWAAGGICQSLLAKPSSTTAADAARRVAVRARNMELNAALGAVCRSFSRCRWDNNATFNTRLSSTDVSAVDYFHPSVAGQAKLARVAWCTLYPPPPSTACA